MSNIVPFSTDVDQRNFLSDVKFYEGYSRYNQQTGRYESWEDSVTRVMNMHKTYYKDKLNSSLLKMIDDAEQAYKEKLVLGAQRALQFGGDQLLKHHMRMYNCTSSYADRAAFFGEFFYILLCGAGAGFSVQKHHVAKLPKVTPRNKQAKTHVIDDSIEGWATSADVLLSSFFEDGGKHPEYAGRKIYFDPTKIRGKGSEISGGFKAPGPEPLLKALTHIERILTERVTGPIAEYGILRTIDVYDICMYIADAVLSGGVRRAATICLFSIEDDLMLNAKIGDWFTSNPQRARSNNSVVLKRDQVTAEQFKKFFELTKQWGEPGFIFVDDFEHCFNPCVEISMRPQTEQGVSGVQGCNLTEINGALCTTEEQFYRACYVSAVLGTLQAGYTDFKFLGEETKQIFDREALLGCSLTGWMNNPDVLLNKDVLKRGTEIIAEVNKKVAAMIGIRPAARTTCVKPAGNASVLLGTASGVHPEHAKRYLRTIQVNKQQDVCDAVRAANPYMVEESIWSSTHSDYSIAFPVIAPYGSIIKAGMSATEFLDHVKFIQQHWVLNGTNKELCTDPTLKHNVSNTVVVKKGEWDIVADYLFENREHFTGVSLINETGDKDFFQAPFIEVLYPEELVKKYGSAAVFASGLIVDSLKGFTNLWEAINIAQFNNDKSDQELRDVRAEWIRRFRKFATTYFKGDQTLTGQCLKDVYILHKWEKIQKNHTTVDVAAFMTDNKLKDIDTMGAIACAGGGCEI